MAVEKIEQPSYPQLLVYQVSSVERILEEGYPERLNVTRRGLMNHW